MLAFNVKDADKLAKMYSPQVVMKATGFAIQNTAKKAQTEISRQVRQKYSIKAGTVKEKSNAYRLQGSLAQSVLTYQDNRPNLGRFKTSDSNRGIRVKVRKRSGAKLVKGGFRINRINPNLIWKRVAGNGRKLKVLRTISVPEMVRRTVDDRALQVVIQDTYEKRFNHHFQRLAGIGR